MYLRSVFCGFRCELQALSCTTGFHLIPGAHSGAYSGHKKVERASPCGAMTVMHAMRPPRPRSAVTSTAEVEGFLLSSLKLKIKAEPSFFCPLTGVTNAAVLARVAVCRTYFGCPDLVSMSMFTIGSHVMVCCFMSLEHL